MDDAYALSAQKVLAGLGVDANDGLTDEKVIELRVKHGKNGMRQPIPRFALA